MAKVSALTEETTPTLDDLVYLVQDPGGTPLSRRATLQTSLESGLGKEHMYVPANAMTPSTTLGAPTGTVETATNDVMLETLDFDATADEFAQFHLQMPASWDEGTLICQFVWSETGGASTFDCIWGIQAQALADADTLDTAWGTAVTVTDTATNDTMRISAETGVMTVAGSPAAEEVVYFRVYRDANAGGDTLTVDARLHGVKVHWTKAALNED